MKVEAGQGVVEVHMHNLVFHFHDHTNNLVAIFVFQRHNLSRLHDLFVQLAVNHKRLFGQGHNRVFGFLPIRVVAIDVQDEGLSFTIPRAEFSPQWEIVVDTTTMSAEDAAERIVAWLDGRFSTEDFSI